jgi:hypothetical protein
MLSKICIIALSLCLVVVHAKIFSVQRHSNAVAIETDQKVERDNAVSLKGNLPTYGAFWVPVTLGKPGKEFNLFLDTGT